MYFDGKGTPRDYNAAAQYFQQAADLNDGYSLKFLAIMYERGLLGPVDLEKAGALRAKAAEVDPTSQDPVVDAAMRHENCPAAVIGRSLGATNLPLSFLRLRLGVVLMFSLARGCGIPTAKPRDRAPCSGRS